MLDEKAQRYAAHEATHASALRHLPSPRCRQLQLDARSAIQEAHQELAALQESVGELRESAGRLRRLSVEGLAAELGLLAERVAGEAPAGLQTPRQRQLRADHEGEMAEWTQRLMRGSALLQQRGSTVADQVRRLTEVADHVHKVNQRHTALIHRSALKRSSSACFRCFRAPSACSCEFAEDDLKTGQ